MKCKVYSIQKICFVTFVFPLPSMYMYVEHFRQFSCYAIGCVSCFCI